MKIETTILLFFMALGLVSCFEEDEAVPPYVPPEDVETVFIPNSIYTHQVYFDFSSGNIVAENENPAWDLAFDCLDTSYHIWVNSSNLLGMAHTGSTDMSADFSGKGEYTWNSDKSDGNPDSTAVGEWARYEEGEAVYTNEVILLGQYDGISYNVTKKVQFIHVDTISYRFLLADPEQSSADTIELFKDELFNKAYYAFDSNEQVYPEPPKEDWDMLFTQYYTILYTDEGDPAPYYVRGVWLNPMYVESALDTIIPFLDINATNALDQEYSSAQDAIGYDWKSVEVDQATNSAEYKVRPGYTYMVRDTDGLLFKFRFKSYFNLTGEKGYPSFEFSPLVDSP